jgi:hypothetical protein
MTSSSEQTYMGPAGPSGAAAPYGISTIATASTIAITSGYTHLITGVVPITKMTGGIQGYTVTLVASAQSSGICIIITNGDGFTQDTLSLVGSRSLGLYAGESITFQYDGFKWVEVGRNLKDILDFQSISSTVPFTGGQFSTAQLVIAHNAITFDGATPIEIKFHCPAITAQKPYGSDGISIQIWAGTVYTADIGYMGKGNIQSSSYIGSYSRYFIPPHSSVQYTIRVLGTTESPGSNYIQAGNSSSGNYGNAYSVIRRAI